MIYSWITLFLRVIHDLLLVQGSITAGNLVLSSSCLSTHTFNFLTGSLKKEMHENSTSFISLFSTRKFWRTKLPLQPKDLVRFTSNFWTFGSFEKGFWTRVYNFIWIYKDPVFDVLEWNPSSKLASKSLVSIFLQLHQAQ